MRKTRVCFVFFVLVMALASSCGIPTSMPILPKEVVVKVEPSVSVPLGRVNYNLYGGLNGGIMKGGKGSLDNLLGASWLQDLQDQGITIYDYRPSGAEDDNTQKFLIHYRLDMESSMGSSGVFDLREYQKTLDEMTGKTTTITAPEPFTIPPMAVKMEVIVEIPLDTVTAQIKQNIDSMKSPDTAYLPVSQNGNNSQYEFPYVVSSLEENAGKDFSITLVGLESITLKGVIKFKFTLRYFSPPKLAQGSRLTLSDFRLQKDKNSEPIKHVKPQSADPVVLDSDGDSEDLFLDFEGAELPKKFDLVCMLAIEGKPVDPGSGPGFFRLDVEFDFMDYSISGVRDLELTPPQIASLYCDIQSTSQIDTGNLGSSFSATVGEGNLLIDKLFPSLDETSENEEGWSFDLDMSKLYIGQDDLPGAPGLSLDEKHGHPLHSGENSLVDEKLNYNDVIIQGRVTASIPDGTNKLTFRNFPGGIEKDAKVSYEKKLWVTTNVSLLKEVKALATDIGLDKVNQTIEQELGDDFADFKDWLNYIKFQRSDEDPPDYGLGVALEIGTLNIADGLRLYIDAPKFGLDHVFQNVPRNGQNVKLIFLNKEIQESGEYKLVGETLPDPLPIRVELGLQDQEAQDIYEATKDIGGILTMRNVVPGETIEIKDAKARLLFDWTEISIKPKPHENGGDEDPLPTYPFTGTFPDKEAGEAGIDLGDIPKGLGFYIPEEGEGEGLDAWLYISLIRQSLIGERWTDDPFDDSDDSDASNYDRGWGRNLQVDLPNLDFRVKYGDGSKSCNLFLDEPNAQTGNGSKSENLFTDEPNIQTGTGRWALSRPMAEILGDPKRVKEDTENAANPFMIYVDPSLPESDKAIPLNLAEALNRALVGEKGGPLFFDYTVELAPGENAETGEILLYPEMLTKRMTVSADLLILVPLVFQVKSKPGAGEGAPVIITINSDLGDEDLFRRKSPDDNGYFDRVSSFGFNIAVKNMAGLSAGKVFLESKSDVKKLKYRLPLVDFANPRSNLSLDSGELEKIKEIWPFIPQAVIEFELGEEPLRIERGFNIELQSITVRAGGEYTFETGL